MAGFAALGSAPCCAVQFTAFTARDDLDEPVPLTKGLLKALAQKELGTWFAQGLFHSTPKA